MRRKERTEELIELSKKAKKLGFPQDVEEGDWLYDIEYGGIVLVDRMSCHVGAVGIGDGYPAVYDSPDEYFLIPSFSRCLEWLSERHWCLVSLQGWGDGYQIKLTLYHQEGKWHENIVLRGKTHHEAIAKAVCRILEEK